MRGSEEVGDGEQDGGVPADGGGHVPVDRRGHVPVDRRGRVVGGRVAAF
ncbi:hypothetical protein ACFQV2_09740 [Actinokineospora soli]|uniref:Uncharacterized protein n=1 Tax=Actinokineospora soli TaxID=1048753 RepID=A0ABW2TKP3_9PSEU